MKSRKIFFYSESLSKNSKEKTKQGSPKGFYWNTQGMSMITFTIVIILTPFSTLQIWDPFFIYNFLKIYLVKRLQDPFRNKKRDSNIYNPNFGALVNFRP